MGRLGWFVLGLALGAGGMYAGYRYHFLRTDGGVAVIPKLTGTLSETYLDVRDYGLGDWSEHKAVLAAVIAADRNELLAESTAESAVATVRGFVDQFRGLSARE